MCFIHEMSVIVNQMHFLWMLSRHVTQMDQIRHKLQSLVTYFGKERYLRGKKGLQRVWNDRFKTSTPKTSIEYDSHSKHQRLQRSNRHETFSFLPSLSLYFCAQLKFLHNVYLKSRRHDTRLQKYIFTYVNLVGRRRFIVTVASFPRISYDFITNECTFVSHLLHRNCFLEDVVRETANIL